LYDELAEISCGPYGIAKWSVLEESGDTARSPEELTQWLYNYDPNNLKYFNTWRVRVRDGTVQLDDLPLNVSIFSFF